jgi:aspartate aminotransferase
VFKGLPVPAEDPILGLARLYAMDVSPAKVDLGIGVYKDERGDVPILATVKQAESFLVEHQGSKSYLSSAGNAEFNRLTCELLFDADSGTRGRARTIQTPGGTGALRVAADLLRKLRPSCRIFIPDPTWANHRALFTAAGHEVVVYPYYDVARRVLRFEEMEAVLAKATADDVVLLHGCCHNPSGADLDHAQWRRIAELLTRTGALPLVDLAYQGFAVGVREDAASINLLATSLPEMIVASSYSKNFALYRERVGALTLVGATASEAQVVQAHAVNIARTNYSMPPDHGAAVVAHILGNEALRTAWEAELRHMRERINTIRGLLARHLEDAGCGQFSTIARQYGMFVLLGLAPDAVERLRNQHHVHITTSGRLNVAGLTHDNVERVAAAIAAVARA